jgi:hypothetical protein
MREYLFGRIRRNSARISRSNSKKKDIDRTRRNSSRTEKNNPIRRTIKTRGNRRSGRGRREYRDRIVVIIINTSSISSS